MRIFKNRHKIMSVRVDIAHINIYFVAKFPCKEWKRVSIAFSTLMVILSLKTCCISNEPTPLWYCQVCSNQQLADTVQVEAYMVTLLWIRAIFLFVKRQPSVDHHVTRINIECLILVHSIFIGKQHQAHHLVLSAPCEVHHIVHLDTNKLHAFLSHSGRTTQHMFG